MDVKVSYHALRLIDTIASTENATTVKSHKRAEADGETTVVLSAGETARVAGGEALGSFWLTLDGHAT